MNEIEKKIRRWRLKDKCLIVESETAEFFDPGVHAHLSFPPYRGLRLVQHDQAFVNPKQASQAAGLLVSSYCHLCPLEGLCSPTGEAVLRKGEWHPSIRPERQDLTKYNLVYWLATHR